MEKLCICGCGDPVKPRYLYAKRHPRNPVPKVMPDPNPTGVCLCGCGGTTPIARQTYTAINHFAGKHLLYLQGHSGRRKLMADETSRWQGGRIITDEGYIKIRVGERGDRSYRLEHRVVMEKVLGRKLAINEQVHHLNGDKTNNRPENLELWHRSQPNGVRREDYHCPGCCCPK